MLGDWTLQSIMVKIHDSIVQRGGHFQIQCSNDDSARFHCLLCPKFKPTTSKKIQRHMDCHLSTALRVKENTICRCNQPCRPTGHYHCPFCEKTIIRREDMESHVVGCQNTPPPSLTLEPLYTAASQEITRPPSSATPAPAPPVTSVVPPSSSVTSAVPPSPATTSAVPNSELRPSLLDLPEEPMECNASVVEKDHCYTLPPSVSLHSRVASPVSSDIPAASQPEASSTDPPSPEASVADAALCPESPDTMMRASYGVKSLRLVRCPHCSLRLYKKNLAAHMKRKHGGLKDITAASHLKNVCVDETHGIFAVQRVSHGFSVPIHVQRKTWGNHHQIKCGLEECHKYQLLAKQSGLIYSLCEHIRSLDYCTKIVCEEFLNPGFLEELVSLHIVEESMMAACKLRQKAAEKDHVPFSVLVDLGGSTHQLCLSVHEPKIRSFSCFGRVIVTYNLKKQTWHCPCTNPRKACPHKSVGKWHVFQTRKDLLPASIQETFQSHTNPNPATTELERSVRYIYAEKKIPATLPGDATAPRALTDYPACLSPTEETCKLCPGRPRLEDGCLITDKATIVGMNGVNHNTSIYNKRCPECHMDYRYQEWRDGLHNFNDHVILTLELCVYMRCNLQNHVSVSRMISCLESFRGQKFPAVNIVFQAYCHFEALNNTEYSYSCVNCGFFPAVVTMDLHRNRVSKLEVSELETPPEDFDGQHNIEDFWDSVHLEMISRGFFPNSSTNPFVVRPSYEHWAPWIGKETRKSDSVLNTEFKKMPTSETEGELSSVDRLCEDLLKQNEATLQSLCKSSGVDSSGSRVDLIFRLREILKNQQTYVKMHRSIWGTSGGWCVVSCPHGIVYSLKFNLQPESPRDFADLLLSWKHFPNVCLYGSARGLATHTNSRVPGNPPFHPHEGKPAVSTTKNLTKAVHRKLKVSLPWLREKLEHSEENGHPITGSSHHYALYDRLPQGNTKDPHQALRRANLVPELQDCVNRTLVKRLFAYMRKNNYFLNSMAPSTHMFLMRNMIEHRNACCNTQLLDTQLKRVQQLQPLDPAVTSDSEMGQTAMDDV